MTEFMIRLLVKANKFWSRSLKNLDFEEELANIFANSIPSIPSTKKLNESHLQMAESVLESLFKLNEIKFLLPLEATLANELMVQPVKNSSTKMMHTDVAAFETNSLYRDSSINTTFLLSTGV